jgi:dTDP-4-amino-4,6-dideoxygalactose transaminase
LIEDCAQAHLATWHGKVAGSFGAAGAYSFYPTKNLGGVGDAGVLVMRSELLAQRAARLRNYGQGDRYQNLVLGMNSRLDEIHAAILVERLKWLSKFTERRRQIAMAYRARIQNPLVRQLDAPEQSLAHVYHLYVIACEQRDALQLHLQQNQVQALIHYPIPIHKQESCLNIARDPMGLANSEIHASTCLSLPCHPQMSEADVNTVILAVNSFQ